MSKFSKKFNDTDECKLYVVSDLHLGHQQQFLWGKRGYKSAEEHTNSVINIINKICRPKDILFSLGDFCLNTNYDQLENLINRIVCRQFWLSGNHNNPWEKVYQRDCLELLNDKTWLDCEFPPEVTGFQPFDNVTMWGPYLEFNWNGQMCTFFHYPISVWNQQHHGSWALCGHSHGSFPPSQPQNTDAKLLDCGWDLHGKPLDFSDIKSIMKNKKFKPKDHHDRNVN